MHLRVSGRRRGDKPPVRPVEDQRMLGGVGDPPEVNGDVEGVPLVGADLQAAVRFAKGKPLLVVRLDDAADVGDRRPAELAEAEQSGNGNPAVVGHRKTRLLRAMAEVVRKRFGYSNVPSVHRQWIAAEFCRLFWFVRFSIQVLRFVLFFKF